MLAMEMARDQWHLVNGIIINVLTSSGWAEDG